MANYVFDKKGLRKIDKIEELGSKICRLVKYYEKWDTYSGEGQGSALAALADVLSTISRILKSHDKRFKKLEENKRDVLEYKKEVAK